MNEWLPISTARRERDVPVDLWVPVTTGYPWGRMANFVWSDNDHGWIGYAEGRKVRIMATEATHWMPVPDPPRASPTAKRRRV